MAEKANKPGCDNDMMADWTRRRCTRTAVFRWLYGLVEPQLNYCTQHFTMHAKAYAEKCWIKENEGKCRHYNWRIGWIEQGEGRKGRLTVNVFYVCDSCGHEIDYRVPAEPSWKTVNAVRDAGYTEYVTSVVESMKERARL